MATHGKPVLFSTTDGCLTGKQALEHVERVASEKCPLTPLVMGIFGTKMFVFRVKLVYFFNCHGIVVLEYSNRDRVAWLKNMARIFEIPKNEGEIYI
jgi:hypothetical protein